MKKLMFLMMALMVAPAMAAVTFSIVDNADGTGNLVVTVTAPDLNGGGDSLVAGMALDVSVSTGDIVAVTNYMTTGESVDTAEGYGIYMGTVTFTGDPCTIDDVGTPVAPASAPDTPGQLGTSAITLEFGCLYDVSVPADAPEAVTTLCTIGVSEEATLTLTADVTRNGVVLIGGGAPISTNLPYTSPAITGFGCIASGHADYAEWDSVGQPPSWCNIRQCYGEASESDEIFGKGMVWIGAVDLGIMLDGWKVAYTGTSGEGNYGEAWIAADFDRSSEAFGKGTVRVGAVDLGILLANWKTSYGGETDCND